MDFSNFKLNYDKKNIYQQLLAKQKRWMWIVLFGCLLLQMFPYCVSMNLSNVFVGSDWLAWTQGNTVLVGLTFTMGSLAAAIIGPFIAKLFKMKINMKFVYTAGVILAIFGFCFQSINSFAEIHNVPAATTILWTSNILSQVGVMIFSGLGINNLISKWWPAHKRGFALGLAFTGGSIGNIWMSQLLGELANRFKNFLPDNNLNDYVYGQQYATYLILGAMGLIGGIIIVLFICRKPLPPTEIFGFDNQAKCNLNIKCVNCENQINGSMNQSQNQNISPLEVKKYPLYYVLAFGFMILQMGVIHSSVNGIIIGNSLCLNNPDWNYVDVLAIGRTVFGVSCLVGNFSGGILNDRLGPHRSMALAGLAQCSSILCLLFSAHIPQLIYVYFILCGISVYAYTSTPSYIAGRLFGTQFTNEHNAIFGIFKAGGFAIANSIFGLLIGPTTSSNIHYIFDLPTQGNMVSILVFSILCLFFGTSIISLSSYFILKKGINGLKEYSPSKYSWIVFFKHQLVIKLKAMKYTHQKKPLPIIDINIHKLQNKRIEKLVNNHFNNLSMLQKNIIIDIIKNNNLNVVQNPNKQYQSLIEQGVIECREPTHYSLTFKTIKQLVSNLDNCWFFSNVPYRKIIKKCHKIYRLKNKSLNNKYRQKVRKINHKLKVLRKTSIDVKKQDKHNLSITSKINKLSHNYNKYCQQFETEKNIKKFSVFNYEYNMLTKINELNERLDKDSKKLLTKEANLNKKIAVLSYILNYNMQKNNESAQLLILYYINQKLHLELLLQQEVNAIKSYKIQNLKHKAARIQAKYNKLSA